MTITAKQLARIMFEELEREDWGDIDPYWFKWVAEPQDGEPDYIEVGELAAVLERVVSRLNAAPEPETAKWWECSWCDGCGWYEGGADPIQTKCEKCGGRGAHNRDAHRGRPIFDDEARSMKLPI